MPDDPRPFLSSLIAGGCTYLAFHLCVFDWSLCLVSLHLLWLPLLSEFCLSRTPRTERKQTHALQLSSPVSLSTSRCSHCLAWLSAGALNTFLPLCRGAGSPLSSSLLILKSWVLCDPVSWITFLPVTCTGFHPGHPMPVLVPVTRVPPQAYLIVSVYRESSASLSGDISFQCLASLSPYTA